MRILLPLVLLLLSACSSLPSYQKATDKDFGYTIKDSDRKDIFDVRTSLPEGIDQEFRKNYQVRAAGEECLSRGFMFWDIGALGANSIRSYCYKRPSKKSLGVIMSQKNPKALIVEDTLVNAHAPFRANDVVKKIGGVEVESIGDFKEQIFRLAESDRKTVTVQVERSNIAISLEAPFSEQRESVFTPEMLETVRAKVK